MTAQSVQHPFVRSRSRVERLAANKLFWLVVVSFFFFFPIYKSLNRTLPPPLPVLGQMGEWSLMSENSQAIGTEQLKGKIKVMALVATNCGVTCDSTLAKLGVIQHRLRGVGTKAAVLSVTTDPGFDTPEVLYKKARQLHANAHVRSFLTGDLVEIQRFYDNELAKHFQLDKLQSSSKLILIDHKDRVRGLYNSSDNDINKMMIDIGLLINFGN